MIVKTDNFCLLSQCGNRNSLKPHSKKCTDSFLGLHTAEPVPKYISIKADKPNDKI